MGLENVSVVDAIGTEPASDCVVLSIIDSWDWSDKHEHLLALQNKLNSYFGFNQLNPRPIADVPEPQCKRHVAHMANQPSLKP